MDRRTILILFLITATLNSFSQKPKELSAEYQRAFGKNFSGNIAGARFESYKNKSSFSIGLTYHFSSKKSYSVAKGFGLYAGYRYGFSYNAKGSHPFAGFRVRISFENFEGKSTQNSMMITPTAEAGYHYFPFKNIFAAPALSAGYTLKISKDYNSLDEDNGMRIIPSLAAGYRF